MRFHAIPLLLLLLSSAHAGRDESREELIFWSAFGSGPPKLAMDQFVQEFNESHQDLGQVRKFEQDYAQLEQKLLTAVAGNVAPDIVLFNRPNVAGYAFRGALEPWDPYLKDLEISGEEFFDACWKEGLWEGRQYCIPMNTDVRVLFYNRRLFREAGLDPDQPPRTWDELREMNRKLTVRREEGGLARVGFVPLGGAYGNTYFPLYAYQMGDDLVGSDGSLRVNGPLAQKAMQWVVDVVTEIGLQDVMLLQTAAGNNELSLFLQERVAMSGNEGYLLSLIKKHRPDLDFGVAGLPWPAEGRPATWSGGFGFVLPRGKTLTPLGKAFIQTLCSRPIQLEYGKISDQIPALKSAAQDPYFSQDPIWRVFVEEMDVSRSLPVSPLSMKMFLDAIRATDKAVYGEATSAQALNWLQEELDQERRIIAPDEESPVLSWRTMVLLTSLILTLLVLIRFVSSVRKVRSMTLKRSEAQWAYLMSLPAFVGLAGLAWGPMFISILLSGCNYDVLNPARWIGADNYRRLLFQDPLFPTSLLNTLVYVGLSVPLGAGLSLILALLLHQRIWLRSFWRAVFFFPSLFPVVAGSFLWLWLFNGEYGLINLILSFFGVPAIPWFSDPAWAKPAMVLMNLWGIGGAMIIFLAALQTVPRELYEVSWIDGASAFQRFRHITLPLITPSILFILIMGTIGSFQVFTQAYLMTGGGPLDATTFYVLYLFRQAFTYFHMGYGAAMAWVLFVMIGLLTALQFKMSKRWVNTDMS